MQAVVLIMFEPSPYLRKELEAHYRLIGPLNSPLNDLRRSGIADEVVVALTHGKIGFDNEIMGILPKLGLIASYGAGYEKIDLDLAQKRNIRITNGRGNNASCVADTAIALLLAIIMRIPTADAYARSGRWDALPPKNWKPQPGVGGKRLGILGLGKIGVSVAQRAQGFELEIGYHNRLMRSDVDYRYFPSVFELATWADYLVLAVPESDGTRNMVDAAVLRALGSTGYLVNVGRGTVVDETALIEALNAGIIAGAGLDVFAQEPEIPEALRNMPNTVLFPHLGGVSDRAFHNLDMLLLQNLTAYFGRRPLLNEIPL